MYVFSLSFYLFLSMTPYDLLFFFFFFGYLCVILYCGSFFLSFSPPFFMPHFLSIQLLL